MGKNKYIKSALLEEITYGCLHVGRWWVDFVRIHGGNNKNNKSLWRLTLIIIIMKCEQSQSHSRCIVSYRTDTITASTSTILNYQPFIKVGLWLSYKCFDYSASRVRCSAGGFTHISKTIYQFYYRLYHYIRY